MLAFTLLSALAFSAPYDVTGDNMEMPDWDIKRTTVPPNMPDTAVFSDALLIGTCINDAQCPGSVGSFTSSWAKVSCVITEKEGASGHYLYMMVFSSNKSSWPSTWPSSVTCTRTLGSNSWTATADLVNDSNNLWEAHPEDNPKGDELVSASTPFKFKIWGSSPSVALVDRQRLLANPAAAVTVVSNVTCKRGSGADWTGVTVSTASWSPYDVVKIKVNGAPSTCSAAQNCYCRIQKGGVNVDIPVQLTHY